MRTRWFDNEMSGEHFVGRQCASSAVAVPRITDSRDGRVADATRAGHIPAAVARIPTQLIHCMLTPVENPLVRPTDVR